MHRFKQTHYIMQPVEVSPRNTTSISPPQDEAVTEQQLTVLHPLEHPILASKPCVFKTPISLGN